MSANAIERVPAFPTLDPGITLLSATDRSTGALQSLVLDHLLVECGEARWIDARGNAGTTQLARVAPSMQVLDRVQVARAFTPFQHYSLVEDLEAALTDAVSLLVVPAVDYFYAADELRRGEGEAMVEHALDRIEALAETHGVPALLTRHATDGVGSIVSEYAETRIECRMTQFGPRFSGGEFETLVFETAGGVQTTLAYWQRVLEARHDPATAAGPTAQRRSTDPAGRTKRASQSGSMGPAGPAEVRSHGAD